MSTGQYIQFPGSCGSGVIISGGNTIVLQSDSSVVAGNWVYVDSTGTLQKAKADVFSTSRVVGVVESKLGPTFAVVILTGGQTSAIFSGLDTTKDYFLSASTAGAMTDSGTIPSGSGNVVVFLGRPSSATNFLVNIGIGLVRA